MQDIRRKIGDQTLDLTTFWDGQLGDLKSVAIESPQIDHFSAQLYQALRAESIAALQVDVFAGEELEKGNSGLLPNGIQQGFRVRLKDE